ncbi:MAG TPA: hypothetical protein VHL59_01330, partial [Thermoanaerobaculia bacterium]|nr:hypothetical protein [Thermoanaerobaculia bacterium]
CSSAQNAPTAYETELAALDAEIAAAAPERLLLLLWSRASLTAGFDDFARFEQEIDRALRANGPADELHLYRASLHFKLHRLQPAKDDLDRLTRLGESSYVQAMRADIALQEGRYADARRAYEAVIAERRTWDHLSRLAWLESKSGNPARADALYAEAADQLTAKEMRAYAWVELQRGLLDLDQRRYKDALEHYRRADRAYSGYWLIEDHIAEVLDLLGKTGDAIELYERIVARTRNPEYVSTLAKIVARENRARSEELYRKADALFAARYAQYPEAAIGHYVDHLLDRADAHPRLLELAERNHRLRPNAESSLLLAKACVKLNQPARARQLLAEVSATPWRTPELAELERELE